MSGGRLTALSMNTSTRNSRIDVTVTNKCSHLYAFGTLFGSLRHCKLLTCRRFDSQYEAA